MSVGPSPRDDKGSSAKEDGGKTKTSEPEPVTTGQDPRDDKDS